MPSDFLKRHTLHWWENPPKKRRAKKARRSAPRKRAKSKGSQVLHATKLGRALELRYVHAGNGKAHKHKFNRGTSVAYTACRRYLIVGPVNVNPYIEG